MAKAVKTLCDRCESKIVVGVSFCDHCGWPTQWASHEERTSWEVRQWKTADRSMTEGNSKAGRGARKWPFSRKADKPALSLVSAPEQKMPAAAPVAPEPVAAPAPTIVAEPKPIPIVKEPVRQRPARAPVSPIARRTTVAQGAPKVAPSPRDAEPLRDTPATVLAMRLLAARVAELESRIRKLEDELAEKPTSAQA